MAIQTRFYVLKGPSDKELHQFVDPSVNGVERFRTPVIIVDYDDTVPNITDTIDAYMDQLGFDDLNGNLSYDVFERPGNPAAVAGRVRLYGLNVGGVTQLFAKAGDGTRTQLTPAPTPPGFIDGCVPSYVSATTVQISAGACKDKNDKNDLALAAAVNVDITVIGVNGLDVGPEVANSWYFIFVIGDTTGVNPTAGLLSASQNVPTLPAGYDIYRRIGTVRNQGSDFRPFEVVGTGSFREVQYRDALTSRQRLTGGAATVVTNVSCGPVIPNTSALGRFQIGNRGTVDAWIYDDVTQPIATYQRLVRPGLVITDAIRVSGTRDIAYACAAAGGLVDLYVTGYQESI